MVNATPGFGQQDPSDSAGDFNGQVFVILQQLAKISTMKIVKIKAVNTTAKTVDVQPMVNMLDGDNQSSPHGTIAGIPYWAWQFGKNAIQADPVVGDIGVMVCADRDSSSVIAAKAIANPGSARQLDAQDGIYFGGILNGVPEQWIKFTDTGLELHDKNSNSLISSATGWAFTGQVTFNGLAVMAGGMQLSGNIVNVGGGRYSGNIDTTGTIKSGTIDVAAHHHTAQGALAATTAAQP